MSFKVLHDHFKNAVGLVGVATGVAHGATTTIQVLPHHHGHFPDSGIRASGTGWDHAVVEEFVIQRVGPAWRFVFVDRHGGVVREVRVVQHFEHLISANLEKIYHVRLLFFAWLSKLTDKNGALIPLTSSSFTPP